MSKLVIVPTPIGNLGDVSARAIDALSKCDIVLCEDTRICSKLLNHLMINKKMLSYRDDNEEKQVQKIIEFMEGGNIVCLTSDAGTPAISDPGYRIVNACRRRKIPVESIPGPCALITALAASGLPSDGFLFLGFLPSKTSARINTFKKYADFDYTLIFYESCHRIMKFLGDLQDVMGETRVICVAREMTKLHETFHVGEIGQICGEIAKMPIKGEYVIVVAPQRFKFNT
ncbi:MAG: 16S rRNA (cytidine(1402)-2'-O)-methyltransferase [Puniceicoccales bacterium]|jgi:16S rRNA (cytidine1402-2'-O)-methyltransferase|nr:16S rRNA (cytidine(1402)-2'-O)-methyltransferase [Puniceicoccales bacterium]